MSKWLAAAAVVLLVTGCNFGASAFHCDDQHSCGANAQCELDVGLCSVPNEAKCGPGGRSYDQAGGQTGQCVGGKPQIDAGIDASIDSPPDAPRLCFGTGLANGLSNICLQTAPTMDRTIAANAELNTDDTQMCTPVASGGGGFCVVAAATISVDADWRAYGSKPLVLIARDSITISANGVVDVASHRGATQEIGAGGDPASCLPGTVPTSANTTNGGGAGGSFAGKGGNGGNGAGPGGGNGGDPAAAITVLGDLRGGCAGQDGQGGGATKGLKGHGGGAVVLIAGIAITVIGKVNAAGEGGSGGVSGSAGGGGGGAGGMIVLDAPTITATGLILANGGGGGEGSGTATQGDVGDDPTSIAAAAGGSGLSMNGANGGNGSAGAKAGPGGNAGNAANNSGGGGGGGGGGAGLIKSTTTNLGTMVSPARTP